MKVLGFVEKYSLYVNGKAVMQPKDPSYCGNLIEFSEGMEICIGETVPGKELKWLVVEDKSGIQSWFCDRNLVNYISRDKCENLINMPVEDGVETDLISFGKSDISFEDSEWYQVLSQIKDADVQMHTTGCYSWGKEIFNKKGSYFAPIMGYSGSCNWSDYYSDDYGSDIGWRPALRMLNTVSTSKE